MTVLDLINKSAIMLNIPEVVNGQFDGLTTENEQEFLNNNFALNRLFQFSKVVLNEINFHMPKVDEVVCQSIDKKISLSAIPSLMKIIGIKNKTLHAFFFYSFFFNFLFCLPLISVVPFHLHYFLVD